MPPPDLDDFALVVARKPETGEELTLLEDGALTLVKDVNPGPTAGSGFTERWGQGSLLRFEP